MLNKATCAGLPPQSLLDQYLLNKTFAHSGWACCLIQKRQGRPQRSNALERNAHQNKRTCTREGCACKVNTGLGHDSLTAKAQQPSLTLAPIALAVDR